MSMSQHESFDPDLVILSFALSFIGAYLCIGVCEQLRMSLIEDKNVNGKHMTISHRKKHLWYLFLMSVSLGGVGIWGMHFIGMHAFHLKNNDGMEVEVMYNVPLMATSFLAVTVTTFIGLLVGCYDPMFSKTKVEIMEEFIEDSKKLSLKEIRKISAKKIMFIISTKELMHLLIGGTITGTGICIAHYIGMLALVFNGHIIWRPGVIAASVIIAVIASVFSFWIVFRLLSIFPEQELLRVLSGILAAMAATGMHYIGMLAAFYRFKIRREEVIHDKVLQDHLAEKEAFQDILIASFILMWAMAMFIMWQSRVVIQRQAKIIRQADSILYKIAAETTMNSATTHNTMSSGNSSSLHHTPTVLKNMVEQYVTKRCRAYAIQRRRPVSGAEGSITLEKEQQQHMGFVEYVLHLLLLLGSCRWRKFWLALSMEADSTMGDSMRSSQHSNASSEDNNERVNAEDGEDVADRRVDMMEMAEMLWTTRKSQNDSTNSHGSKRSSSYHKVSSKRQQSQRSGSVAADETPVAVTQNEETAVAAAAVADSQLPANHNSTNNDKTNIDQGNAATTTTVVMIENSSRRGALLIVEDGAEDVEEATTATALMEDGIGADMQTSATVMIDERIHHDNAIAQLDRGMERIV